MRTPKRVSDHIRGPLRGPFTSHAHVFLPQSRMRRIRWEEAMSRSMNKRGKRPIKNLQFVHWDCMCGSIECLRNSRPSGW